MFGRLTLKLESILFFTAVSFVSVCALGAGWWAYYKYFVDHSTTADQALNADLQALFIQLLHIICAVPFIIGMVFSLIFFFYITNYQRRDIAIRVLLGQRPFRTFISLFAQVILTGLVGEGIGIGLGYLMDHFVFNLDPIPLYLWGYAALTIIGGLIGAIVVTSSIHHENLSIYLRSEA